MLFHEKKSTSKSLIIIFNEKLDTVIKGKNKLKFQKNTILKKDRKKLWQNLEQNKKEDK